MESGPVTVFTTRDPGLLALAKSLLESAGIEHNASGEFLQNIPGQLVWIELQVPAENAAEAQEILADLRAADA
jgi:hypothetical protein